MHTAAPFLPAVAELQGLYGAFSFSERLLQKIWLRGDFDRAAACTADGRRVRILHPGKWNLLGGPDFRSARLRFADGPETTGDIEVHLHVSDWEAHGHARDPAYDRVLLHVVLFPVPAGHPTVGAAGPIPTLTLLPLLHHALEEFAAEEAVEVLANRAHSRLPDELGALSATDLAAALARHATARWNQKIHFARLRVQRLGWPGACHHAALEILGYRFNRAPMLRVAGQWPIEKWSAAPETAEAAYAAELGGWSLQGVRPANHPRRRLRQYAEWSGRRPDWPDRWRGWTMPIAEATPNLSTRDARRMARFTNVRAALAEAIGAGGLSGSRFDTLVCDGLLPLAATTGRADGAGFFWQHWFAGDLPPTLKSGLRQLGVFDGRAQPACHGLAQGLLGWLIEREAREVGPLI